MSLNDRLNIINTCYIMSQTIAINTCPNNANTSLDNMSLVEYIESKLLSSVKRDNDSIHQKKLFDQQMEYEKKISDLRMKIDSLESMVESLTDTSESEDFNTISTKLEDMLHRNTNTFVENITRIHLNEVVKKKDDEIARLKNSNNIKGITGENFINDYISHYFDKFEVDVCSKESHVMDIMVMVGTNSFFTVESKLKTKILTTDVTKFNNDFDGIYSQYNNEYMGGIFVSMCSPNIPTKGSFLIEIVDGCKVKLYLGFVDKDDMQLRLKHYINMFLTLQSKLAESRCTDNINSDDVVNKLLLMTSNVLRSGMAILRCGKVSLSCVIYVTVTARGA